VLHALAIARRSRVEGLRVLAVVAAVIFEQGYHGPPSLQWLHRDPRRDNHA
jgi:hypothetical protein